MAAEAAGADAVAGSDADLAGYFEDGYSPEFTAAELVSYMAQFA